MKIKAWPRHVFDLRTALSADMVIRTLRANCSKKSSLGPFESPYKSNAKYFSGDVFDDHFQLERITSYRNSFSPIVSGSIQPDGVQTLVKVEMKLSFGVMALIWFWLTAVGLGGIVSTVNAAMIGHAANKSNPAPVLFAMFALGATMTWGGFWFEATAQEKKLRSLLDAPAP
jgi:hypothetical protein